MSKIDDYESEVLRAFEADELPSVATKSELERLRESARATALKDRRVNIRLSSADLSDVKERALQQGVPYQTLIASVVHRYVTGQLTER